MNDPVHDRPEYGQTVPQHNFCLSEFPPLSNPVRQTTKNIPFSKPDMTEVELWVESESVRSSHWPKYLKQSKRVSFNDTVEVICYPNQCQIEPCDQDSTKTETKTREDPTIRTLTDPPNLMEPKQSCNNPATPDTSYATAHPSMEVMYNLESARDQVCPGGPLTQRSGESKAKMDKYKSRSKKCLISKDFQGSLKYISNISKDNFIGTE